MQGGHVRLVGFLWDTWAGAEASEMQCIKTVLLAMVCAPCFAAVQQSTWDVCGANTDHQFDCEVVFVPKLSTWDVSSWTADPRQENLSTTSSGEVNWAIDDKALRSDVPSDIMTIFFNNSYAEVSEGLSEMSVSQWVTRTVSSAYSGSWINMRLVLLLACNW